jgi:hypothetical protein
MSLADDKLARSTIALIGEDEFYRRLGDADSKCMRPEDLPLPALNPLRDIDVELGFYERGISTVHEFREAVDHSVKCAMDCLERRGQGYSFGMFTMFDGNFHSTDESAIGQALREMHSNGDFWAWAPLLQRIARALDELPDV